MGLNELARASGVGNAVISRLETGQLGSTGPGIFTIERLAQALGVRVAWLVSEEGAMLLEPDSLPNRTAAAQICRDGGFSEESVAAILALDVPNAEQKTTLWWIEAVRLREASLLHEAEASPAPPQTFVRKRA